MVLLKRLLAIIKRFWIKRQRRKKAEKKNFADLTSYTYYGDVTEEGIRSLEEMIKGHK